jgi:hypothetical protein
MDDFERDVIQDYAFQSQHNLSLALKIGELRNDIISKIIKKFLSRLSGALLSRLEPDLWELDNSLGSNPLWCKGTGIYISKRYWQKRYRIGLESDNSTASAMMLCLRREAAFNSKDNVLLKLINAGFGQGGPGPDWAWCKYEDGIYRNLTDTNTLTDLHLEEKGTALSHFTDRILKIKDLVTKDIDQILASDSIKSV